MPSSKACLIPRASCQVFRDTRPASYSRRPGSRPDNLGRMPGGPRDYTVGTERALFRFAEGTCYFPDCPVPIMTDAAGNPVVGVEIAHIRGANEGSARFDASMTDIERASISNLILLCTPHHKLIDRIAPDDYPVEVLTEWKAANEPADGLAALDRRLNESNLEGVLERIVGALTPQRQITVELATALTVGPGQMIPAPYEHLAAIRQVNPRLRNEPLRLVTTVRNVGSLDVIVESVNIYFWYTDPDIDQPIPLLLAGRNDHPYLNPVLPHRLSDAASMHWASDAIAPGVMPTAGTARLTSMTAAVALGSGEVVKSEPVVLPADET